MQSNLFDLTGRVCIITGGAGLLGVEHAKAIAEAGGIPVLCDLNYDLLIKQSTAIAKEIGKPVAGFNLDITVAWNVKMLLTETVRDYGRIDILINNAAINSQQGQPTRFEDFSLDQWNCEMSVGLTGAFLCSQIIGGYMAGHGGGVIVNIGSDYAHIAPDQRIYEGKIKPVSYSVVKHGIHGLTQYLAAYWADKGVRVNTLSPGGVQNGQPAALVERISNLVPMGRMAQPSDYAGAIQFLCSDASAYMTGQELIMDGGRAIW